EVLEDKDIYLADFAQFEKDSRNALPWLQRIRSAAAARFGKMGLPTTDHEEWRFTNLAPLAKIPFKLAPLNGTANLSAKDIEPFTLGAVPATRLVFINGHFSKALSAIGALPGGVIAGSLAAALETDAKLIEPHLARHASDEDHPFVAL